MAHQPLALTDVQRKQAIEVMGRAFLNDPFLSYLAPDDARRARLTPQFVGGVVNYCFRYGEVWTLPSIAGVACWLPPGKTSPSVLGMLRTGLLTTPLKFGWAGFQRFNAVVSYTDSLHKQHAPTPHWYLWGVGVDPTQQRKGLGGTLLQPVLSKADVDGNLCYLETQNEANLPFYQRFGFVVVSSGVVPDSHLGVWALMRQPGRQLPEQEGAR